MDDRRKLLALVGLCVATTCGAEEEASATQRAALDEMLRSEPVAVVGLAKELQLAEKRSDWLVRACQAWTMSEADVQQFFTLGATSMSEEWHHGYSNAPCRYRGTLLISNRAFEFWLNGGAYAFLRDTVNDVSYFFGCRQPCATLFETFDWGPRDSE